MWIGPAPTCDHEPLYVEVSALLNKRLTGIGRFAARLIEALNKFVPIRLVTTIQEELARSIKLSTSLLCGQEIRLRKAELDSADGDVALWVRELLRRPRRRHDLEESSRHPGLYTMLLPPERHFRRELCMYYDFTPVVVPWAHTADTREHFGQYFTETSAHCDKAVAISHSTKFDSTWLSGMPAEDVICGYPGPSLCVHEHAAGRRIERRKDVILVVSTWEPRKNARFLLDWFLETSVLPEEMEMWWVGPPGWLCDGFKRFPTRSGGRKLSFLGSVNDARLCTAYRQAAFTIYPSLYEGFGFPVLDSLWHGTPVLSSYNSSLQEFTDPGVYFFDGCMPETLDEAYREMRATWPVAVDRNALEDRYSWDALAATVLNAI